MATVRVGDHDLYVERRGSGEPLLLIQGLGGNSSHWGDEFLDALDGFEVILLDNRGMGRSGRVETPFSIADLADDAAQVLAELDVASAHVVGLSMGGMIAQELAVRHPQRVRTLALIGTTAGGPESVPPAPTTIQSIYEPALSGDVEATLRAAWRANVSEAFAENAEAYAAFRERGLLHPSPVPVQMLQVQAIAGHDTTAGVPDLKMPVLIVHGTEDLMVPVANGRRLAELQPAARVEILEDLGHVVMWERPREVADLVREHIAQYSAEAS